MRRCVYVLDVALTEGVIEDEFAEENPVVSRTIEIQGHQTLEQLHQVIFKAFHREQDQFYEFQLGEHALPESKRYVSDLDDLEEARYAPDVTIQELKLKEGDLFEYLFDYEDAWLHQIDVASIQEFEEDKALSYPRISRQVGQSPPQYLDW